MTSDPQQLYAAEAFVWVWLPGATKPVVAGRLFDAGVSPQRFSFAYGRSYLERKNAIRLSPFELPLEAGVQETEGMGLIPACLRDGGPDAWGRRILESRFEAAGMNELDYLLLSGSDRIGALDFQTDSRNYVPRNMDHPRLDDLVRAADFVEKRHPLPPELEVALMHGTSVGGARPKALLDDGRKTYIAKFSSAADTYDAVKAEFIAMRLALRCGLDSAPVSLVNSMGKDVVLVERFDREDTSGGVTRRLMLSALSLLQLDEMEARHASYIDLADLIRQRFTRPRETLRELFRRVAFNILVGNTDDHARNHAAFWDGDELTLTPAYDICPQLRTGGEASQAMQINGARGNLATLDNLRSVCNHFFLTLDEATVLIDTLTGMVESRFDDVCDEAGLPQVERRRLWGSAVFNPFCFENWDQNQGQ